MEKNKAPTGRHLKDVCVSTGTKKPDVYKRPEQSIINLSYNQILKKCTPGRDRTGKDVTPSVFETDASTNSATRASDFFNSTVQN